MNIEDEIFKKSHVNYDLLIKYGFKLIDNEYVFEKNILNDSFLVKVFISNKGLIKGKIYDLETNLEYNNFRLENALTFAGKVRYEYENILNDIKNNCFDIDYFPSRQANMIVSYLKNKYNDEPEFLFKDDENTGVFRNKKNKKWYGIIMNVNINKFTNDDYNIDIMNIKLPEDLISELINKNGYHKAYHMNKKSWITMLLNDTIDDNEIIHYIEMSYEIIDNKK